MNKSLMERAQEPQEEPDDAAEDGDGGEGFKKPDISQFIPPEMKDVVDRVVAAGVKIMYSPQMREQVRGAIESNQPTPQKLAENTTGLLLTLDQQTPSGIPAGALFPVGIELLGESSEVLQSAGQDVTQEDFNQAARMMFVLIGQKLGGSPEQIMGAAEQALPGGEDGDDPAAAAPDAAVPPKGAQQPPPQPAQQPPQAPMPGQV